MYFYRFIYLYFVYNFRFDISYLSDFIFVSFLYVFYVFYMKFVKRGEIVYIQCTALYQINILLYYYYYYSRSI